jgi:hypothetical protein
MEKKLLFGTLAGAVTLVVLSMAIFMGLLGSMAERWFAENAGCVLSMEESPVWVWIVATLVQAFFLAYLLHRFGVTTFKGGLTTGAWISFLMMFWYGLWTLSTYKAYTLSWLPIDVLMNTVVGTLTAGVIGLVYGKVK